MSSSISTISSFNGPSSMRSKTLFVPALRYVVLCLVTIVLLAAVLGSTKPIQATHHVHKRYNHYTEVLSDFSKEISYISGMLKPKLLSFCPKGLDHFVPCYNGTHTVKAGSKDGKGLDRCCESSNLSKHCLLPSPKEYHLPFKWPSSQNKLWCRNVKIADHLSTRKELNFDRYLQVKEDKLTFILETDGNDALYDYLQQIKRMISDGKLLSFRAAGIRTVLDFSSTYASFAAHLLSEDVLTMTVAPYEVHNSQVQIALERGFPAVIASFQYKLPISSLSFDMLHCFDCGIDWRCKDGLFAIEADRMLRVGGYFVWTHTSPLSSQGELTRQENSSKGTDYFTSRLCWTMLAQQDHISIWQKITDGPCHSFRMCEEGANDVDAIWYQPLSPCVMTNKVLPFGPKKSKYSFFLESFPNGIPTEKETGDPLIWLSSLNEIWSLLTPLIFSDHPKRPGEEDPMTPSNVVRNVMDMNARDGDLNAELSLARKPVWVMNVVPSTGPNTLSAIYKRGFIGVLHDWCEAFPTYPRTYDMLYAVGFLSGKFLRKDRCKLSTLFVEMDRILRPEGWIILQDDVKRIEEARGVASQMQWETRLVEIAGESEQRLLVCQKGWRS